jgi:hypothetical protein
VLLDVIFGKARCSVRVERAEEEQSREVTFYTVPRIRHTCSCSGAVLDKQRTSRARLLCGFEETGMRRRTCFPKD